MPPGAPGHVPAGRATNTSASFGRKQPRKMNLLHCRQKRHFKIQHDQEIGSLAASKEVDINEDAYWEKKLPNDYQHYVYMSNHYLHYTTKKELYVLLCAGFLGYNGKLVIPSSSSSS
ncbi:hypothetical protein OSB04_un001095 [Centaurea solstitialis]|uniref:Uncharacterized protein n=1 Tax=Centaurea solstitialis TaxID=347529 RepID=A0AA38VUX3_9ASTR|nr:hypothetical protein OSB04_un001095 [Centaurea solstitialis]